MADVHTAKVRSYNMSKISGKDTKPELLVRRFLHNKGFRYRLHVKQLPGSPDIVLPKYKIVIFVNGCFWHAHQGCRYFVLPKTKTERWREKLDKNVFNDFQNTAKLKKLGWRVIQIWECDLKRLNLTITLNKLLCEIC